jgi:hypothetical protein
MNIVQYSPMLVAVLLAVAVYLSPSFLAFRRNKTDKKRILIWNILFGWTAVGWWICLYLALKKESLY